MRANERPRRFTAEQARHFLSQFLDEPSDNVTSSDSDWPGEEENDRSRSRSRSSSTGSHRSHLALDLIPVGNWTIALSHLGLALM